jgi:hypothetical protein
MERYGDRMSPCLTPTVVLNSTDTMLAVHIWFLQVL